MSEHIGSLARLCTVAIFSLRADETLLWYSGYGSLYFLVLFVGGVSVQPVALFIFN